MTRVISPRSGAVLGAFLALGAGVFVLLAAAPKGFAAGSSTQQGLGTLAVEAGQHDHVSIGVGVARIPEFQGSDHSETIPFPLVDIRQGRLFISVVNGIGVDFLRTPNVTAGISINWMRGYDGDDVPQGIKELDGTLSARLFTTIRSFGFLARISATQAVGDTDRGRLVDVSLAYPLHPTKRLTLIPELGTTWGNADYMNSYFGVSSSEAAASGLSYYRPGSGFKDVSFNLTGIYRITRSVSVLGSIGVTRLLDHAADSPIVERETEPMLFVGFVYTF